MSASGTSGRDAIVIAPGEVSLATWRMIVRKAPQVSLAANANSVVETSQRAVTDLIATGRAIYGVNTGFGKLASVRIDDEQLGDLQRNLILSHCAGTGPLLDDSIVHLIMVMKANALAQGQSGVSWQVVDSLLRLANTKVYPCIPAKGSVGASGDLAPLAHMAAVMMGEGEARHDGRVMPAVEALAIAGLKPLTFG
ncbi:MAG: aromatic amino acid lyase, partial [Hyphomicrobium sp.]